MKNRTVHDILFFSRINSAPFQEINDAYQSTKEALKEKINLIDEYLAKVNDTSDNENIVILVGVEDFFDSVSSSHRFCFDTKATYESFSKEFLELSKKHPNVIISPGSMYLSTEIPPQHANLKFEQDNVSNKLLEKTVCYTTNIMPVFYNGQLLRIIRKGEKVIVNNNEINSAEDLDKVKQGKIKVISYHEDELTDYLKSEGKNSTCYLGKTLLPGESELIQEYLAIDITQDQNIFNHAVDIEGKKFLFLICGEFNLAYSSKYRSTSGSLLEENTYDYIVHSTVGGDIFKHMQKEDSVYIHSDFGGSNKLLAYGTEIDYQEKIEDVNNNLVIRAYHI